MGKRTTLCSTLLVLLSTVCVQTLTAGLSCSEPGFFSIPESCQEYYECRQHRGNLYAIPEICADGTLFDDIQAGCVPENLVTSPLQCVKINPVPEESTLEANPETTIITVHEAAEENLPEVPIANKGTVEAFDFGGSSSLPEVSGPAENGNERGTSSGHRPILVEELSVCEHEKIIESYASLVTSSPYLVKSSDYKNQYHQIRMQYNSVLQEAKNHIPLWRQGDSIVNGLKNTYYKANEYRNELQRKIDILNKQLRNLSNHTTDPKVIQRLEKDIENLRQGITQAQEALAVASVPQVQKYFEGVIVSNNQEIEQKLKELRSDSKDGAIVKELIDFLGFIQTDFNEIGDLSNNWQRQLKIFLSNLENDAAAFTQQSSLANDAIDTLTQDYQFQQQSLSENTARQHQLESRKQVLNADVGDLTEKNEELGRRIQKVFQDIEKKTYAYNRERESRCQPNGLLSKYVNESSPLQSVIDACNRILASFNVYLDVSAEQAQLDRLRGETKANSDVISRKLGELESITNELRALFGQMSPYTERQEEIEIELNDLRSHASETENLREGVNAAISSVIEIGESLQKVQNLFGSSTVMQNLIDQGNAADNDADRHNFKQLFDRVIANMKDDLAHLNLPNLNNCI